MKANNLFETFTSIQNCKRNTAKLNVFVIENEDDLKFFNEKIIPFWNFEEENNLKHKYNGFQFKNEMTCTTPSLFIRYMRKCHTAIWKKL